MFGQILLYAVAYFCAGRVMWILLHLNEEIAKADRGG